MDTVMLPGKQTNCEEDIKEFLILFEKQQPEVE